MVPCCFLVHQQHTAKHLVLQDGGRKYLGGIEELLDFVQSTVVPPFDRSEDDRTNWVAVAQEKCKVRKRCPFCYTNLILRAIFVDVRGFYLLRELLDDATKVTKARLACVLNEVYRWLYKHELFCSCTGYVGAQFS